MSRTTQCCGAWHIYFIFVEFLLFVCKYTHTVLDLMWLSLQTKWNVFGWTFNYFLWNYILNELLRIHGSSFLFVKASERTVERTPRYVYSLWNFAITNLHLLLKILRIFSPTGLNICLAFQKYEHREENAKIVLIPDIFCYIFRCYTLSRQRNNITYFLTKFIFLTLAWNWVQPI